VVKKKGFLFPYETVIVLLICVILFSGGAYQGSKMINNFKADELVRQCEVIDTALVMYSKAHTKVLPATVSFKEGKDGDEL